MALADLEQLTAAVRNSQRVLVCLPQQPTADAVGSSLALAAVLRHLGKLVTIAGDGFTITDSWKFLPGINGIEQRLRALQKFIITVNVSKDQIEEFSYDTENSHLKIFITPKAGALTPQDISSESSQYLYDLIITLDTPDLAGLGALFSGATDFFYGTTIINIDHKASNEQYGQINFTNPNACATAELTYQLIAALDKTLITKEVATCLLTGLIAKTKSFKTINVTPAALETASALLHAGADQTGIIKSLYRSRSLPTINLWGRALSRLRSTQNNTLVWSSLSANDFLEAGADQTDLPDVIDELIAFIPGIEIVVLFHEENHNVRVLVRVLRKHNALFLAATFAPTGSKEFCQFVLTDKTLIDAEKEVIGKIKEQIERTA
jgi:phosphoesterase RecJ-like protein